MFIKQLKTILRLLPIMLPCTLSAQGTALTPEETAHFGTMLKTPTSAVSALLVTDEILLDHHYKKQRMWLKLPANYMDTLLTTDGLIKGREQLYDYNGKWLYEYHQSSPPPEVIKEYTEFNSDHPEDADARPNGGEFSYMLPSGLPRPPRHRNVWNSDHVIDIFYTPEGFAQKEMPVDFSIDWLFYDDIEQSEIAQAFRDIFEQHDKNHGKNDLPFLTFKLNKNDVAVEKITGDDEFEILFDDGDMVVALNCAAWKLKPSFYDRAFYNRGCHGPVMIKSKKLAFSIRFASSPITINTQNTWRAIIDDTASLIMSWKLVPFEKN